MSLATLHNEDDIRRKDIREGDRVIIQRAGDVIPQVVGPAPEQDGRRRKAWRMPDNCPVCSTPIVRAEGEARHYCPNRACPSRGYEGLKHFVSRGAMDIDGVGEKLVARLVELELVSQPQDFYRLTVDQLVPLDGFQETLAENVITSIERSKSRPFDRVLFALGIRTSAGSPPRRWRVRSARWTPCAMRRPSRSPRSRASARDRRDRLGVVRRRGARGHRRCARGRGAHDVGAEACAGGGALSGKTFVVTGTLEGHARDSIAAHLASLGAKVTASVSASTDYVLAGEGGGSKRSKAETLGVPVIDLAELERLAAEP